MSSGGGPPPIPETGAGARPGDSEAAEVGSQVRALVDGDPNAAAWLYDTFADTLYRRLRHRYGYPGGLETDDLLHDAFVFYFQREAKILADFLERTPPAERTRAVLARYLWDLACGVASNRRRSSALRITVPIDELRTPAADGDLELRSIDRDLLRRLDECLSSDNARVYLYFKLRYRDGLEPQQIVTTTGWSRKATYKLRQALNDAVARCAELLGIEP